ncbi:MAG TPA: amino acid ABC transporter substrate-binding protein [Candidatus Binatia bacterium]
MMKNNKQPRRGILTRLALSGFLLALLYGCATVQQPGETLGKIKSTGVLAVGYLESAPPFSFVGSNKTPVGYSVELCTRIASSIQKQFGMQNLKIEWIPLTVENRIAMVADGKVDIECSTTTATLSRQERIDFSLMTFADGATMLTRADSNVKFAADLNGKRIAVIPGTTTEKVVTAFAKKEFIDVRIVPVKDHAEGLAAVEKKAAEAFASDRGILIGVALTSKDPTIFALGTIVLSYEPYGFMVRRNDPAFRLAVNRALAALYRSGEIFEIYDKWFGAFGKPSVAIQAMYLLNGLPD